jgi:chorismate dehydratase
VPNSKLRVGRIAYTNVAPIETAFERDAVERDAVVTSGAPSTLNALLSAGELDVSPVSAAHFLRNAAEFARGAVISVLLVSPRPPALLDGASIAVTGDSATGRALLESVLRGRYGVSASFERVENPTAAALEGRPTLLIGDAAVAIRELVAPETIYDLGTAWFDWTGFPMVYAVWAVRRDVAAARPADVRKLVAAYDSARRWGTLHREAVIDAAVAMRPRSREFYETYYTTLSYRLDADARRGLARFGTELAALETIHVAR